MNGKLYVYRAGGSLRDPPEVHEIGGPVAWADVADLLDNLRTLVGDDIEQVPYFNRVAVSGEVVPCVAFCGENGKAKNLPVNRRATLVWRVALSQRNDIPPLMATVLREDVLVGDVVIAVGDKEFMEAL